MGEDTVIVIADRQIEKYERDFGNPRHEANIRKFDKLFECIDDVLSTLNKIKGGLILGGFLFGLPAFIASILVIVRTVKGH
jgi:hypothetical protein